MIILQSIYKKIRRQKRYKKREKLFNIYKRKNNKTVWNSSTIKKTIV